MASSPRINVHASLPRTVKLGADLNLDADNWEWVHCLALPLEKLNALRLSHKPYKWIRYAIGGVIGAQGVLSAGPDSLIVVDLNAGFLAESADLYYHTSNEEKRRMFPVDPDTGRTHVTSSVATPRRVQFPSWRSEPESLSLPARIREDRWVRGNRPIRYARSEPILRTIVSLAIANILDMAEPVPTRGKFSIVAIRTIGWPREKRSATTSHREGARGRSTGTSIGRPRCE